MIRKITKTISQHKIITGVIILLILGGSYSIYKRLNNKVGVRYVLAAVQKGTITVSVSGTGQVSASDQLDIKAKVSGDVVINVNVKNGQEVKKGTLIAQLDREDAQKTVDNAEADLENAQISLAQAQQNAESDIKKTYEDGFNEVTNIFIDLPNIMAGLKDILFGNDISNSGSWNLDFLISYTDSRGSNNPINSADSVYYSSYHEAKNLYGKNFDDYKLVNRSSDRETIKSLIDETYQTTGVVAEAAQDTSNLLQSYKKFLTDQDLTTNSTLTTYISDLSNYLSKLNSHLASLLSFKETMEASTDLDPYGIKSKELSVEQKENALDDTKEALAECSIFTPFDGVVAEVDIKNGDSVSANSVVATLITKQQVADITLNEVDVAKVKVGQKATLTFDALPDVTISGEVLEVSSLGTVSQGVVSYGVKIALDTQDDRVKPGMSVTADIITDVKQNILFLPNNAIKSQGSSHYVEFVDNSDNISQQLLANVANASGVALPKPPTTQEVEIGISNDTSTEIISGLNEGDIIVTSSISSNNSSNSSTINSSRTNQIRIPAVGGFRGGD